MMNLPRAIGLIDTEGYPAISRRNDEIKKTTYLEVFMTDYDVVEDLKNFFGFGSLMEIRRKNKLPGLRWKCEGHHAIGLLQEIYPYLSPWRQKQSKELFEFFEKRKTIKLCLHDEPHWTPSFELYWLSGALEGDGCFLSSPRPQISLEKGNQALVERVHSVLKGSCFYERQRNDSLIWRTVLNRQEAVEEWLKQLLPLMGIRRSEKIKELLAS